MRRSCGTIVLVALSLAVGCRRASPPPASDFSRAATRGIQYLVSIYSPDHLFEDPYLTCEGQIDGCDPAFRELDHAVLVAFWLPEDLRADPRLARIIEHSKRVLDRFLARWRDKPFDLTAIDLYALFPYYYPGDTTRHMLDEVVKSMNASGDWEPYSAHGLAYRKVTDELWTILALVRNHVAESTVHVALERKREEAERILHGDFAGWRPQFRFYGLSHVALTFWLTAEAGYDIEPYRPLLDEIETWLTAAIDEPAIAGSTALVAEDLAVLSLAGHPAVDKLERMARLLVARQEGDGRWRLAEDESKRAKRRGRAFASAHTTLIALAALDAWSHWEKYAERRRELRWRMLAGPAPVSAPGDESARPPVEYSRVHDRRLATGFPVTTLRDIQFINETRQHSENSVLFFRAAELRSEIDRLSKDPSKEAAAAREHDRALLEIVEKAAAFRPNPLIHGERTGSAVTLRVALELDGPGATDELAARARSAIEAAWSGAVGTTTIATRVETRLRTPGARVSPDALTVSVPDGEAQPYTRRWGDPSALPTVWPAKLTRGAIAHEMGHFFGFADEYHVEVRGGFYFVVYDRPEDLMSCPFGRVRDEQLSQLARAYATP